MTSFIDLEWLNTFIAVLTPILVAVIGAAQVKRDRRTKRERALQAELDQKKAEEDAHEKQALVESLESLAKRINTVGERVDQINTQVGSIADDQKIQKKQLEKLSRITEVNLEYSRSLGAVVVTMGNAIRTSDMSAAETKSVDAAISDFRDTEQNLMNKLYKAMY